jgi:hypothetical protein
MAAEIAGAGSVWGKVGGWRLSRMKGASKTRKNTRKAVRGQSIPWLLLTWSGGSGGCDTGAAVEPFLEAGETCQGSRRGGLGNVVGHIVTRFYTLGVCGGFIRSSREDRRSLTFCKSSGDARRFARQGIRWRSEQVLCRLMQREFFPIEIGTGRICSQVVFSLPE